MPSLMVYVSNDVFIALSESGKVEGKTPNKKAGEIITTWFNQIPEEKKE